MSSRSFSASAQRFSASAQSSARVGAIVYLYLACLLWSALPSERAALSLSAEELPARNVRRRLPGDQYDGLSQLPAQATVQTPKPLLPLGRGQLPQVRGDIHGLQHLLPAAQSRKRKRGKDLPLCLCRAFCDVSFTPTHTDEHRRRLPQSIVEIGVPGDVVVNRVAPAEIDARETRGVVDGIDEAEEKIRVGTAADCADAGSASPAVFVVRQQQRAGLLGTAQ